MHWQSSPYTLPLFLGSLVSLISVLYIWRYRRAEASTIFSLLMACMAIWSAGYALQLAGADIPTKLFWRNVKNIGVVPVSTLWLITVLTYTGYRRWLTRRNLLWLAVEPTIGLLMAWTNPLHGFFDTNITLVQSGSILILDGDYGPWFWVNMAYSYLLFLVTTGFLLYTFFRTRHFYREQIKILLGIALTPWLGNIVYITQLVFHWGNGLIVDITPFFFIVAGAIISFDVSRHQLLAIIPISRDVILHNMSSAVIVFDTNLVVVDMNPMAETLLNCHEETAIGQSIKTVIARVKSDALTALSFDELAGQGEAQISLADSPHHFEWTLSPVIEGSSLRGRVLILRDITDRKLVENALHEANTRLQQEAAQREQLIDDLDAFAHTVAHDLQNPLSVVVGYMDVLRHDLEVQGDTDLVDYVSTARAASLRMGHIINELLTLASVQREDIDPHTVDMATVLDSVEARLAMMISSQRVAIIRPDIWPQALGYAPWLEEVWENLISNAIKYGGNPPVIEVGVDTQADGTLHFWVRDNGNGLSPKKQVALFSDSTAKKLSTKLNHGFGLSIAERIVEKLGGQMTVHSDYQPGQGSTIGFTLPAAPAVKANADVAARQAA